LRDRRCSSGSSRGKAPSAGAGQHGARRRVVRGPHRLPTTPMEDDGGRKPLIPWLESTRLTTGGSVFFVPGSACERELSRRGRKRGCAHAQRHLDATVDEADGAPTPSGARSQSSASWMRPIGAVGRSSNEPWLCSRAVLIAEVDGKRRARSSPSPEGGRSSRPGSPGRRKRRSKPARGGEVARTVADPRGFHGSVRGM
jgi:hypothetical protein